MSNSPHDPSAAPGGSPYSSDASSDVPPAPDSQIPTAPSSFEAPPQPMSAPGFQDVPPAYQPPAPQVYQQPYQQQYAQDQQIPYGQTPYSQTAYPGAPQVTPQYYVAPVNNTSKNWMGILALVFGVLGGWLAFVFGYMSLQACKRGEANNKVMAQIGIVLAAIWVVGYVFNWFR